MPSRIRIGPDGGPYVIVEEDNGDVNISSPNGNVDFQTDDISNVGALTADSVSTDQSRTADHPVIDVSHPDYGAVGDGSTDDLTAINNAIAEATPGGTVRLVNDNFAISAPLDAYQADGVTIEFLGDAALVPVNSTSDHDGIAVYDQSNVTGSATTEDLTIKSPKFVGTHTNEPWETEDGPGIGSAIRGINVDNLTVSDPHFEGVRKGVHVLGGQNGPSQNVSVSDVYADHVSSHVVEFTRTFTSVKNSIVRGIRARYCGNDDPNLGANGLIVNFSSDCENSTASDVVAEYSNNLMKGQGKDCTFSDITGTNMGGFGIIAQNPNKYSNVRITWRDSNLISFTRSVSVTGDDVQMEDITVIDPPRQLKASGASNWQVSNALIASTETSGGSYVLRIEPDCSTPKFSNVEFRHSQSSQNPFRDESDNGSYSNCRWFWNATSAVGPRFDGASIAIVGNQFDNPNGANDEVRVGGDGTFVANVVDSEIGALTAYETAANQIITQ